MKLLIPFEKCLMILNNLSVHHLLRLLVSLCLNRFDSTSQGNDVEEWKKQPNLIEAKLINVDQLC